MVNAKKKTMDLYEKKWTKNPFCYLKVKKGGGGGEEEGSLLSQCTCTIGL